MNSIAPSIRPIGHVASPQAAAETSTGGTILSQFITIARRRKWLIAGSVGVFVLLGLIITLLLTPKYTALTTIEIQRETGSFVNVEGAQQKDNFLDQEFYQTQYGLLQSQSLAERVATSLRLYDDRRFFEMFGAKTNEWFPGDAGRATPASRTARIRVAGAILLKNIVVEPERLSRLVTISFTSPDPALSKRVMDAWTQEFIQQTLQRRFEATAYARRFLESRLTQLRSRIDESERQLVAYAGQQGIINLPAAQNGGPNGAGNAAERSLAVSDLATLNDQLNLAIGDRVRAESRLKASGGTVTEALENQAISTLRQRRAETAADYAKLMVQFEPNYPPARALKSQIDQLDRSIANEENRVSQTLRDASSAAQAREAELRRQVASLKTGVLDLRRRSIQYNIFEREVDTNRQLYDALLQRYKEIGVAGGVGVNNISIVDTADLPTQPSSPRIKINVLLALILGLLVGGGLAFVLEQIDQGISDPSEVETALAIPLLGTIPKLAAGGDLMAYLQDRKSELSEAYFSLQTTLSFSTDHGVPRTLVITSSRPAEGKSTTSYALARSLTRLNRRVLLIDTDMRSPSVHRLLDLPNKRGLSNYLSGDDDWHSLVHVTEGDLNVITAGPHPPSTPELLSSDRFVQLLQKLREEYEYIMLDAPPVMGLADAPIIASVVEGVVFVIESQQTQKGIAHVAIGRLQGSGANIIGGILTKFDARRAQYGYGYGYGYSYAYGEKGTKSA